MNKRFSSLICGFCYITHKTKNSICLKTSYYTNWKQTENQYDLRDENRHDTDNEKEIEF